MDCLRAAVRFTFVAAINKSVERWLAKYIPGYETYKAIAEEKLHSQAQRLSYTIALGEAERMLATGIWCRAR